MRLRACVALLALALAGCSSAAAEPSTATVRGQLSYDVTISPRDPNHGHECGQEEYADLKAGTQVTLTGADGKIMGVGALAAGTAKPDGAASFGDIQTGKCVHLFTVSWVRRGGEFYTLTIGTRPPLRYAEHELFAGPLKVELS